MRVRLRVLCGCYAGAGAGDTRQNVSLGVKVLQSIDMVEMLSFLDGVYDFSSRTFTQREPSSPPGSPASSIRASDVGRQFPRRDVAMMAEVRERCLLAVMEPQDVSCYLAHLARALAGHDDCQWLFMVGRSDSGKSMLHHLNEYAWDEMTAPFEVESISRKAGTKRQGYPKRLGRKRTQSILTSNYAPSVEQKLELNGAAIDECFAGPGCTSRLILMGGPGIPDIVGGDLDRLHILRLTQKFDNRLGGPYRKYIQRNDVIDAYILLVLDAYADSPARPSELAEQRLAQYKAGMRRFF